MLSILVAAAAMSSQAPDWEIVVLGVAQDAGIPHLGCDKGACSQIRAGKRRAEMVACLGLRDNASGASYLFDATPDIRRQLTLLNGGKRPAGIFLTHAHMGHYTGLTYLGRESVDWKGVQVHCTPRMASFLQKNDPWRFLIANGNLSLREISHGGNVELAGGVSVHAFKVPHRDELSDTVGYLIRGPRQSAVYVPDTDAWEKWSGDIRQLAERVDLLFLDGTFSSPEEVGGRDISQIPHPMMSDTRDRLKDLARPGGAPKKPSDDRRAELWFIHLNHTNPALDRDKDVAKEGQSFRI
jgi:pyrroloquinoline quinone biosynthesis protein B